MKNVVKLIISISIIINVSCEQTALNEGVPPDMVPVENPYECGPVEIPAEEVLLHVCDEQDQQSTIGEDSPIKPEDDEE
ncbi:MAG: hypothetical protein AAFO99_12870 [Bacteroidota bacterium]